MSAFPARQVFSREEARRVLRISERQLRSWEKQGLLPAREDFALNDLLAVNTLIKLRENRVPPRQVRRAVSALREKIQNVSDPLTELRIYSERGRIRVDIDGGTMEPVTGQLLLNFGATELKKLLEFPDGGRGSDPVRVLAQKKRLEAELLFEKGLEMEHTGAPVDDIIAIYEHAVSLDPLATGALVNLGTLFFNAKKFGPAEKYYLQALRSDPEYALAHFNLGNLYDEVGNRSKALEHYKLALKSNPQYGDAHYNIALLYQTSGEVMKAVLHWKAYLKNDASSAWAVIARRELEKLKEATIVRGRA